MGHDVPPSGHRPSPGEVHADSHRDAHRSHVVPVRTYVFVFVTLLVMTALTVWAANQDFGPLNMVVALGIATFKATLVILFFMHVKYSSRLTQLVVGAAFLWLGVLIVGTLHDYYAPDVNRGSRPPSIVRQ
ncbi:MAG TPA: cytochrome C oxidase subunit IV family protein [Vicinamibacteria bacterium]|nr:cytochrome C oxidase subunit IV family protein [Vicinamibacteria bacterium]